MEHRSRVVAVQRGPVAHGRQGARGHHGIHHARALPPVRRQAGLLGRQPGGVTPLPVGARAVRQLPLGLPHHERREPIGRRQTLHHADLAEPLGHDLPAEEKRIGGGADRGRPRRRPHQPAEQRRMGQQGAQRRAVVDQATATGPLEVEPRILLAAPLAVAHARPPVDARRPDLVDAVPEHHRVRHVAAPQLEHQGQQLLAPDVGQLGEVHHLGVPPGLREPARHLRRPGHRVALQHPERGRAAEEEHAQRRPPGPRVARRDPEAGAVHVDVATRERLGAVVHERLVAEEDPADLAMEGHPPRAAGIGVRLVGHAELHRARRRVRRRPARAEAGAQRRLRAVGQLQRHQHGCHHAGDQPGVAQPAGQAARTAPPAGRAHRYAVRVRRDRAGSRPSPRR